MNQHFDINLLENSEEDSFRDNFYFYCQENSPLEIQQAFLNKSIKNKLNENNISFGLMGSVRSNNIENAKMLLECIEKYTNIKIKNISFNSAINLAMKKDYLDFAHNLIELTGCMKWDKDSIINRHPEVSIKFISDTSGSMHKETIIEGKYNKFQGCILIQSSNDINKLEFILKENLHIGHVKNMLQNAVEKNNMIPLISFVKSNYLEPLLEDEEFKIFINNQDFKSIKNEFQNLINNALLEKKLNKNLPLKNTKGNQMKI